MVEKKFFITKENGGDSPHLISSNSNSKRKLSEDTKNKISVTMKKKGIYPKERYSGEPWNKGKKLRYPVWNKGKNGLQKSTKKGKTFEEIYGEKRAKQIFPLKDSSIEIKIQNFLTRLHIEFFTHKYISEIRHAYQCDIFIPKQETEGIIISKNTILECDGCYWHGCPKCNKETTKQQRKQIAKDNRRKKELIGQGYNVVRLWEHEIKPMELNNLRNKI